MLTLALAFGPCNQTNPHRSRRRVLDKTYGVRSTPYSVPRKNQQDCFVSATSKTSIHTDYVSRVERSLRTRLFNLSRHVSRNARVMLASLDNQDSSLPESSLCRPEAGTEHVGQRHGSNTECSKSAYLIVRSPEVRCIPILGLVGEYALLVKTTPTRSRSSVSLLPCLEHGRISTTWLNPLAPSVLNNPAG